MLIAGQFRRGDKVKFAREFAENADMIFEVVAPSLWKEGIEMYENVLTCSDLPGLHFFWDHELKIGG